MPHTRKNEPAKRIPARSRACALLLSALLAVGAAAGTTSAYLMSKTDTYVNTFVSGLPDIGGLTNLSVKGEKVLDGRDWQEGDSFEFVLEHAEGTDEDGNVIWKPVGDKNEAVTYAADAEGNPVAGFDKFEFAEAIAGLQLEEGSTHSFRILEVSPEEGTALPGMAYDLAKYPFEVTFGEVDASGNLAVSEVVTASEGVTVEKDEATGAHAVSVRFVNKYSATGSASAVIDIRKVVEDLSGQGKEPAGFTFELYEGAVSEGEKPVATASTLSDGETSIVLDYVAADVGKTYSYTLVEVGGGEEVDGMAYDPVRYLIQVEVVDNHDGTLSAVVSDAPESRYANYGVVVADGETAGEGEGGASASGSSSAASGSAASGSAPKYVLEGTSEEAVIGLEASAASADGAGSSSAGGGSAAAAGSSFAADVDEKKPNEYKAVFTNVYDPADAQVTIEGDKTLAGRDMAAGEFEFDLYQADETFAVADGAAPADSATNAADGSFAFDQLTFDKVGTYRFVVAEDSSAALEGVTYDASRFGVTVEVSDGGAGKLTASVTVVELGAGEVEGIAFENSYSSGEGPVVPPDPDDPDVPDPDKPDVPGGDDEPGVPGGSSEGSDLTQTGDAVPVVLGVLAVAALAAAAVAAYALRKSRRSS